MPPWSPALLALSISAASGQEPGPPRRTIPPSLLVDLRAVQDRFELALSADCGADCYSRGCTYVAHTLADRPPGGSLPGLGGDPGPGAVEPQAWLTQARCEYAYEGTLEPQWVQALTRRLQTRASTGYTTVSVGAQSLPPLPVPEAPPEPVEAAPEPVPEAPPPADPLRELWTSLLDDFDWMIGLVLGTVCATTLIWGWRRVGRESLEERAMLAEIERGEGDPGVAEPPPPPPADPAEAAAARLAGWRLRLQQADPARPDPAVQAMLRDLLRAGELPLLAKAVLTFPSLPESFPTGGDVASSKLALAYYLRTADPSALPSDADLLAALDRHASSAALASQRDAEVVRSLREDFGSAGLAALVQAVPPRAGALLFALAPAEAQHELVHLLEARQMSALSEQLLRSNRMDPAEAEYLFEVLRGGGDPGRRLPELAVSDRGSPFDAAGALSTLLPRVDAEDRAELFGRALDRFGGSLPAWYAEILLPDMLLWLDAESRADLLLGADAEALAAWLSLHDADVSESLLAGAPAALRASVQASSAFPSRARQLALADRGRRELARGFQEGLARARVRFEEIFRSLAGSA